MIARGASADSGSLAVLAAILLASSLVINLAAESRPTDYPNLPEL
jgi:hypothetical protein